jgi:uncharacterized lipoprotein YmbA
MMPRRVILGLLAAPTLVLSNCAAPALSLFTLAAPAPPRAEAQKMVSALPARPVVIEIARVTLPDELDNEDILVRDGATLARSSTGRWASRLSLQVGDRITQRLAARRPDALVVNRAQAQTPSYRILINIARLDVLRNGSATLEADWQIVPADAAQPALRDRGRFMTRGAGSSDGAVAERIGDLLDQLAERINVSNLR